MWYDNKIWYLPAHHTTQRGVCGPLWYRIRGGRVERNEGLFGDGDYWSESFTFRDDIQGFLAENLVMVQKVGDEYDKDLLMDRGL